MTDPIKLFKEWFLDAEKSGNKMPDACALGTVTKQKTPSVRFILMKGIKNGNFYFYTNYSSAKAGELKLNGSASMTFFWPEIYRQIRIVGKTQKATKAESDAYWKTRPRDSQIGAWASPQSQELKDRKELEDLIQQLTIKFEGKDVQRPQFWGGYILKPISIEFWLGRPHRVHERQKFTKKGKTWISQILAP